MSKHSMHLVSRHSIARSVRLVDVTGYSLALAYGGGLWLNLLHALEGGHEANDPPMLIHWLRDATLALPIVFAGVFFGLFLAHWLRLRLKQRSSTEAQRLEEVCMVALCASYAVTAASPFHALLFHAHHGGPELPWYFHSLRDGLLALAIHLPIAMVIANIDRRRARTRLQLAYSRVRVSVRHAGPVARLIGIALTIPIVSATPGITIPAAATNEPGTPCPPTAQVKSFDVQAINVSITLNRFGDRDPSGKMYVLSSDVSAVRAQEASRKVSTGLRDDPIQPLVIRANQGDCVEINFTNNATGGAYGIHIDGLAYAMGSSGDHVGNNIASSVPAGTSALYRYYIPNDPTLEGAHYLRPGPGNRAATSHGLFGALVVEPPDSTYLSPITGAPITSGWEAIIVPGSGKAFRENVQLYHEIGDEDFRIVNAQGRDLPTIDPHSDAYRPGSRAINYRSEPFMNRLERLPTGESHAYSSYTFGDPATPMPRSYVGDPEKFRILHAGSEVFHVFHMHGGGIRWRFNPQADPSSNYAATGLNKEPLAPLSPSQRLDSQSVGPGEAYNLEIEGGAGGVQQGAGEFLFHCHIAHHYVAGMWSFWRVFDTRQEGLYALSDRPRVPDPVNSADLIGLTMADGTTLTAANLDAWIRPQLPPQGVRRSDQDATVWDWTVDASEAGKPIYLGEPEETRAWVDLPNLVPGHPGIFPGDRLVGNRPEILFNPLNGRPAFPLLRPQVGRRPPFSPNGHSGAPYLGERGAQPSSGGVDPWANRSDGICPAGAPMRFFNVVAIEVPITVAPGRVDGSGKIYVLARDKADVLAGRKPAEPLAIRANLGDCIAVTLTSELTDAGSHGNFSKVNMHIHHVQFDTQASDGVVSGLSFEQSIRPYRVTDTTLTAAVSAGATVVRLSNVTNYRPGIWVAVGLGTEGIEVRQIQSIDATARTLTLTQPLTGAHAAGEWAGVEFAQSRWYPDVMLDNVFWHDHVDGLHTWGQGLVGQLIVEPKGSTYHDPQTGAEVASGTIVDIHTSNPVAPGLVTGSFREVALWTIDENAATDSTINLRAAPWSSRLLANGDPSLLFSSYTHGDPNTPLPRAYPGDPLVIRTINVGVSLDTLHLDGHRVQTENRYLDVNGKPEATLLDTIHYGVSERFTLIPEGGAGGVRKEPGDYLYMNGIGRRFRQGAWGLLRVLPGQVPDLKPLPGITPPAETFVAPAPTGGRPPAAVDPGDPCPAGAPQHAFQISAVDVPGAVIGRTLAFVPSADVTAVRNGTKVPEPLVMHVAAGECVTVEFTNASANDRASFHVSKLLHAITSSGANVGFNPEQTVAPGSTQTYRFYADTDKMSTDVISDFGGKVVVPDPITGVVPVNVDTGPEGLYGAIVVAPPAATFTDPATGAPRDIGSQVDVHVPGIPGYRDFTLAFSDRDPIIGGDDMPYETAVSGPALINYTAARLAGDTGAAFAGARATPLLRAYPGDPVKVHVVGAPGSEQGHVFSLGGQPWHVDPNVAGSNQISSQGFGAWETVDIEVLGGAGGVSRSAGDYFYGDLRRPFTQAGMWGLMRVQPDPTCPIKPLDGLSCMGQASMIDVTPPAVMASPKTGLYNAAQSITLAASEPGNIYYTLDGSDPARSTTRTLYTGPFSVAATTMLKFMAVDRARNWSAVSSETYTIDTVAPDVSIVVRPATLSADSSPSLDFSAAESGVTFKCSLSSGADDFAACNPPKAYGPLADGTYTFKVQATDRAGNTGAPTVYTFSVDTQAPTVVIDSKPSTPLSDPNLSFSFTSEAGVSFVCSLSTGVDDFEPCASPASVSSLPDGAYTFKVKGIDAAGNTSDVASYSFVLDATAPSLSITSRPTNFTRSTKPSFSFSSTEAGVSFTCSLSADADAFVPCTSPASFGPLTNGSYTFKVKATDTAGNTSGLEAYSFTVDTVAPVVQIASTPPAIGNNPKPAFSFASEEGVSFRCSLWPVAQTYVPCASPVVFGPLADGVYIFRVRAYDAAGNASPIVGYQFRVDTVAPSGSVVISAGAVYTESPIVSISTPGTDAGSGLSRVRISNTPATSGGLLSAAYEAAYVAARNWSLASTVYGGSTANGSRAVYVQWRDRAGNWSEVVRDTIVFDTIAPVVQPPIQSLAINQLSATSVPVQIAWGASDVTSGVARYALEQSSDGGVTYTPVALPTPTTLKQVLMLDPEKSYRFRVQATDHAGKVSAWRLGPLFKLAAHQETSRSIAYTGSWTSQATPDAFGGTVRRSAVVGSVARLTFGGRSVEWIASRGKDQGRAEVWLDGIRIGVIDLYAATTQPPMPVLVRAGLAAGSHTLEVRVLGSKQAASSGTHVNVDAFVVLP